MNQPRFTTNVLATFDRAKETFQQRGSEYGDTWQDCQFLTMKAVARKLGIVIPDEVLDILATAAFCDMKYQRLQGGYKDDSVLDGVNYNGYLTERMRQCECEICETK